ncbi:hypothetical protein J2Y00_002488 [Deinococcus soli (ex Cha et al. 2016)]|uniref:Uncharacterized protein n=2 Tax=Deinococcus soli (ex Cha et al. 2016) TaxID=1309411 RepID=A0ACC6KH87_9DEIO|nr:hypothetical protein [Deinococcus soli (ex Cha et al. 2016)]MDR6328688.1 hypothetical protein [Deinococcus soli (ex Cha et al. 2016)]MDR6751825.1 hypothetical protein [Deinococcus soli (ex Cha et al. 2016)]
MSITKDQPSDTKLNLSSYGYNHDMIWMSSGAVHSLALPPGRAAAHFEGRAL